MDVIELTEKIVKLANKDEKLKENIKDTDATIVMDLTDAKDKCLTFSISNGNLECYQGKPENIDFQFEISEGDYTDLITGKKAGLTLMASKKLRMVKGSWSDIGTITTPLLSIPKFGKEIVSGT